MSVTEMILTMAKDNNGTVTSAMIDAAGISRGNLKYLSDSGKINCVCRGVYVLPELFEDEMYSLQVRFSRGIYSGETALFLLNLTDRTPIYYSMTFPSSYNVSSAKKENIRCSMIKEPYFSMGISECSTPGNHTVKCYNMEKTLCDILRSRADTDIQVISEAFKQYVKRTDKNIHLLSEYSKIMGCEDRVRKYLEVLL